MSSEPTVFLSYAREDRPGVEDVYDSLRAEGQSQQRKAEQEKKADEARAEAERHEERAEAFERTEERHQGT